MRLNRQRRKNSMQFNYYYLLLLIPVAAILWWLVSVRRRQVLKKQFPPYTQALSLLLLGEKKKALLKLRQAVKEDTENISAYILYGDILREIGKYKLAAKIHKELTIRGRMKPSVLIDVNRSLLMDYLKGKVYKAALECVEELLSRNRRDIWTLRKKLDILEAMDEWRKAFETAKKLQSITGDKDTEQLALYRVYEGKKLIANQKREHDGRLRFREAIKIDKKLAMSYIELASSYIREKRYEDAVKTWKQLFANNPAHAYLCFEQLEKTMFDLNRFTELESIYRKLLESSPDNSRAVVALASFLHRKGNTKEAIQICQDGIDASPQTLWIRRNLFRFYAADGKYKEASAVGLELLEMVTRKSEEFVCSNCGYYTEQAIWRCPECGKWRTFKM